MSNWSPLWDVVPLKDIAEFRNGINFGASSKGRGIKVIGVGDFQDYVDVRYDELDEINPEGVVRPDDLLRENDFVFVRSNGNRALIGRSLFVRNLQEKVTHSGFTIRLRFTTDRMLPEFFAQLIRSDLARDEISHFGSGTNISNLSQEILGGVIVPLPPLAEQRAIAAILSTWDEAITLTTRLIEALKRRKQALLELMLVYRHELPEGWRWARLGEFIKRRSEWITIEDDAVYSRCTVKLYNLGIFPRDQVYGREIRTKRQQVTEVGDLLVAEIDAKVGGFGIVKPDTAGSIVSSHYYLFEVSDSLVRDFLEQCIYAGILERQVDAVGSTNYAAIRSEQVETYRIPFPSRETQHQIASFLSACDDEIRLYTEMLDRLATQKRGLMQQLLTGAVRVGVGD